ncbi:MAG TPA: flagellar assembly protein FliW [Gemmatimonadales bacterium]|nr:flagellar assembly protein FliW [Gemmatimonadales bacterium]
MTATAKPFAGALRVASRLFGPLEIAPEACYTMPEGMLGFAGERRFVLLPAAKSGVFWMQSVDDGALIFLVVDPFEFVPGYDVDLPDVPEERREATLVLTIVTLPREKGDPCTTNLQAPLVFDVVQRAAGQIVLQDPRYHTRHSIDLKSRLG